MAQWLKGHNCFCRGPKCGSQLQEIQYPFLVFLGSCSHVHIPIHIIKNKMYLFKKIFKCVTTLDSCWAFCHGKDLATYQMMSPYLCLLR